MRASFIDDRRGGRSLPVNNAMGDVNHLAVTNIKDVADRCR
jgi:hypothetical protein